MSRPHRHWKTGEPCTCTFTAHLGRQAKTASKLDWLKERPDKRLQTPEGQAFLNTLEKHHNDKTDALMPWLAREWKKGRLIHNTDRPATWGSSLDYLHPLHRHQITLTQANANHWADWFASNHPTRRGVDIMQHQMGTMHDKIGEWDQALQAEQENADQKKAAGGKVVHQYPDGWSVRKLGPEHVGYEGDAMGHCVGGYGEEVRHNQTQIYSLRDPKHEPHATVEIKPGAAPAGRDAFINNMETHSRVQPMPPESKQMLAQLFDANNGQPVGSPGAKMRHPTDQTPGLDPARYEPLYNDYLKYVNNREPRREDANHGQIVQIQGKSNEVPNEGYQARLKDWFGTFPEASRPAWDGDEITHVDQIPGHMGYEEDRDGQGGYGPHGDYGVKVNNSVDYPSVLESMIDNGWRGDGDYEPDKGTALYNHAVQRGEIPQLAKATEDYTDRVAMPAYQDHELNALDSGYLIYPGEEWDPEEGTYASEDEWHNARSQYEDTEREIMAEVPQMQVNGHMWEMLHPHHDGRGYQNVSPQTPQVPQVPGTFSKTANIAPHPHFSTGEDCYCPWGGKRLPRYSMWKEASKLDWLRERPDVKSNLVKHLLVNHHFAPNYTDPHADSVLPWIMREHKKGRLFLRPAHEKAAQDAQGSADALKHHLDEGGTIGEPYEPYGEPTSIEGVSAGDYFRTDNGLVRKVHDIEGDGTRVVQDPDTGINTFLHPDMWNNRGEEAPKFQPVRPTGDYGEQLKHNAEVSAQRAEHLFAQGVPLKYDLGGVHHEINPEFASGVGQMLDTRSKQRQGIDLMQKTVPEIHDAYHQWKDEEEQKQRMGLGDVMHDFGDGWSIRRLRDREEAEREGKEMGHCVGGYDPQSSGIYSLRDHRNEPHATVEINPEGNYEDDPRGEYDRMPLPHGGRMVQIQGKENSPPTDEYKNRIAQWIGALGQHSYMDTPYADYSENGRTIDAPYDASELANWYDGNDEGDENWRHEYHDRYGLHPDVADELGVRYSQPEADREPIDWDDIVGNTMRGYHGNHGFSFNVDDEHLRTMPDVAYDMGDWDKYKKALDSHRDERVDDFYGGSEYDPNHPTKSLHEQWEGTAEGNRLNAIYHHNHDILSEDAQRKNEPAPEFEPALHRDPTPQEGLPGVYPMHPDQTQLFRQKDPYEMGTEIREWAKQNPDVPMTQYPLQAWKPYPPLHDTQWDRIQQNTMPADWNQDQHALTGYSQPYLPPATSKTASPLYYRWVFSPVSGEVTLSHNQEGDPASVTYHSDMAGQINEPGLVHGYAYRIGNGWRLTDWESRPVEDPFVVSQVVRKLNGTDNQSVGDWSPDSGFDRMHNGAPQPS